MMLLLACVTPTDSAAPEALGGALGKGPLNPFPSVELVADGHLAIPSEQLPTTGQPFDTSRFALRTGFSRVQPSVARFDVPLDMESLGGQDGLGVGGAVRMFDMDSGAEIALFAETDGWEDPADEPDRTLIVRPMQAMEIGHRVAVAVTTRVTSGGAALSLPAPEGHYADLVAELEALGVSDVAVAWDFPVGDGTGVTRALAAAAAMPSTHALTTTWMEGGDGAPTPLALAQAKGTFTTANWLVDDVSLGVDGEGSPVLDGQREAELFVHLPESLRGAPAGTAVPILLLGHGMFGGPSEYMRQEGDGSQASRLADALGAVAVGTTWYGLSSDERPHALDIAADFGRFQEVPDMVSQGVANTLALLRYANEGALLEDPFFGGLVPSGVVYYFGISLGGIEGAVTLANQDVIDLAVLHVAGSTWTSMLERSSQWIPFDYVVPRNVEAPEDRQLLYALSQLCWDQVDPSSYADDLRGRTYLWQEAMEDEQVPNFATESLMRTLGNPLGTPAHSSPPLVGTVALPAQAPLFTQFDPETADASHVNRPSDSTGAHGIPRGWEATYQQWIHYYTSGGEVIAPCGDEACGVENSGG